jgi:hypothetical protein
MIDPCYPELNRACFSQRMNHYSSMIKWLVVVNVVTWSALACILLKSILI